MAALRDIPGIQLVEPEGAFYMLPDVSAFYGPDVTAEGFGPVPDADTLCRCSPCAPPQQLRVSHDNRRTRFALAN